MAQTLDIPIEELVPHDHPMILIDVMANADESSNCCLVNISPDSPFYGERGVPAFVGLEYMAQAVAAHGGYLARLKGEAVKVGFLLGTPRMQNHTPYFSAGQQLRVEVLRDWGDSELQRFQCRIVDVKTGSLLQEAGLNVFLPGDLGDYLAKNTANADAGHEKGTP